MYGRAGAARGAVTLPLSAWALDQRRRGPGRAQLPHPGGPRHPGDAGLLARRGSPCYCLHTDLVPMSRGRVPGGGGGDAAAWEETWAQRGTGPGGSGAGGRDP